MTKILIIKLSSLGDIVHTFPMVYDIKKHVKNCQIDWLVDESFADLVKLDNNVDNVISIPLRKWKKNKLFAIIEVFKWKKQLSNTYYNYIVDAQGLIKSAIFTKFFTGKVYGYDKNSVKEKFASLFYKNVCAVDKECLAITKNRILAAKVFNYKIDNNKLNFGINSIVKNINKNPYIIFFHATSKNSKKFGINNWVTLADYLIKQHNLNVILPFGSDNEYEESLQIKTQTDSNNIKLCDKVLNYNELVNLIFGAKFVFGVDTGLVHLTNALNKPVIAIYTDTNPQKTGIFESKIAKNIGYDGNPPLVSDVIDLFEKIIN